MTPNITVIFCNRHYLFIFGMVNVRIRNRMLYLKNSLLQLFGIKNILNRISKSRQQDAILFQNSCAFFPYNQNIMNISV